jgi:hypothetical protein
MTSKDILIILRPLPPPSSPRPSLPLPNCTHTHKIHTLHKLPRERENKKKLTRLEVKTKTDPSTLEVTECRHSVGFESINFDSDTSQLCMLKEYASVPVCTKRDDILLDE